MKAILVLIIVAGGLRAGDLSEQQIEVREIEFSTVEACRTAAVQMTHAGRRSSDRARIFDVEASGRAQVPGPVVIAECLQR